MLKLIIWDLDDTLWSGTLADGDAVQLHRHRAELVRAFNARGVVSSICSKNDHATAEAKLRELGLWDEFVFPHIAFTPKPEAIRAIIADMQLRPADVLFVDDNSANLREVAHAIPDIQLLEITLSDADDHLAGLLALTPPGKSRVERYRMLERRKADRAAVPALSNHDFLRTCGLHATAPYLMDNLDFAPRIADLINRSNQLNYTASRIDQAALEAQIVDVMAYDSWSIFAWDSYGRHGLVGFVMVDRAAGALVHFTFSCRIMHMGLEAYALSKVRAKWPGIDTSAWEGRFDTTDPDWIADADFHDPEVRRAILAEQAPGLLAEPAVRVMFDCQSGGIAHYSRFRPAIEFDHYPRVFMMAMMDDGSWRDQDFPPFLVYGATVDYLDNRWGDRWPLVDLGLYATCVVRTCIMLIEQGRRMLVVLPPEDAPADKYRAGLNHTPERCRNLNALWRKAARENPDHVWVLDVADIAGPDEMADVTHYHAGLLQKIAGQVDCWIEAVALGGGEGQAEAA
jgi:FkbH-like protein